MRIIRGEHDFKLKIYEKKLNEIYPIAVKTIQHVLMKGLRKGLEIDIIHSRNLSFYVYTTLHGNIYRNDSKLSLCVYNKQSVSLKYNNLWG